MKRIVIELSDKQHTQMMEHIVKGHKFNRDNETFSGFQINLKTCELGDWLEIDFHEVLDVGDVEWKIE